MIEAFELLRRASVLFFRPLLFCEVISSEFSLKTFPLEEGYSLKLKFCPIFAGNTFFHHGLFLSLFFFVRCIVVERTYGRHK